MKDATYLIHAQIEVLIYIYFNNEQRGVFGWDTSIGIFVLFDFGVVPPLDVQLGIYEIETLPLCRDCCVHDLRRGELCCLAGGD